MKESERETYSMALPALPPPSDELRLAAGSTPLSTGGDDPTADAKTKHPEFELNSPLYRDVEDSRVQVPQPRHVKTRGVGLA